MYYIRGVDECSMDKFSIQYKEQVENIFYNNIVSVYNAVFTMLKGCH